MFMVATAREKSMTFIARGNSAVCENANESTTNIAKSICFYLLFLERIDHLPLNIIITVVVSLRVDASLMGFVVPFWWDELMDASGFFADPAQFHFEEFIFQLVVNLENSVNPKIGDICHIHRSLNAMPSNSHFASL